MDSTNILLSCWTFSKTLEHDPITGLPQQSDVKKLQEAITDRDRKLEGLNEGGAFVFRGTDSANLSAEHPFYTLDSKELASEMIEVYAKAITRDIPFVQIDVGSSPIVTALISDLNSANFVNTQFARGDEGSVTDKTVFRGSYVDETVGPRVSQFLLIPFNYGVLGMIHQLYNVENDPDNIIPPGSDAMGE